MGKYARWLTEEGLVLLEGWARDGLIDREICARMGVSERSLYYWKRRFPEVAQALRRGKEVVDYQVEKALLEKALDGDLHAITFWLKNRKRAMWREKVEGGDAEGLEKLRILFAEVKGK